jgi:hypothetical protein
VARDEIIEELRRLGDEARWIAGRLANSGDRRGLVAELLDLSTETHRLAMTIASTDPTGSKELAEMAAEMIELAQAQSGNGQSPD